MISSTTVLVAGNFICVSHDVYLGEVNVKYGVYVCNLGLKGYICIYMKLMYKRLLRVTL